MTDTNKDAPTTSDVHAPTLPDAEVRKAIFLPQDMTDEQVADALIAFFDEHLPLPDEGAPA